MNDTFNIPVPDEAFDSLLRTSMLIDLNHPFTQKTLDMTAEIVFGTEPWLSPSPAKGKELVARLNKHFNHGPIRILRCLLLAGLLVLGTGIFMFRNLNIPVHQEEMVRMISPLKNIPAVPEHKDIMNIPRMEFFHLKHHRKAGQSDTGQVRKTAIKGPSYNTNTKKIVPSKPGPKPMGYTPIPFSPGPFARNYDWSGFDVKWVPDVKGYIKNSAEFNDSFGLAYLRTDQYRFTHDYYDGAPFRKTPDDLVYINYGGQLQHVADPKERFFQVPKAARFYLDSQKTKVSWFWLYDIPQIPETVLKQTIYPFYFRKYEVTNKEYKEFLNWLARQNGYADFQKAMKTKADVDNAFSYRFANPANPGLKGLPSETINVFPDTADIVRDFPWSKGDKMANTYFTGPGPEYDDYPVMGVNYWQAMAYLDWKTKIYQDYLDKNNIPYKISFELPTDIDWELAASLNDKSEKENLLIHYNMVFDDNWITSLVFSINNGTERFRALDHMLNSDVITQGDWILDGYCFPGPADLQKKWKYLKNTQGQLHYNNSGISWMDNNVSEWMQETYQDNWLPMFTKHQEFLEKSGKEDDHILKLVEDYFDNRNDRDGHLVRGGNFYDERYSDIDQRNLAGIMLKRFVSPSKSYSTIGFRYVVRVEVK